MKDENRDRWRWLPKASFNKKNITKRMRKVETATVRHAHKFIVKRWDNVRDVQRHVIVWVVLVGIVIAATGLQLMWFQQSYRKTAPADNGTYAEAVLGPIDTLNPLFASTGAERSASYLMFSSLLRYDTTGHLNHDLATSVVADNSNTIYTVKIRPDVKWHDGAKLTAKDVAFTVNLMKNPNTHTTVSGWQGISVKVIDDTTIEFTLQATYAAFEHALTFSILPEHILGKISPTSLRENGFSQNPIGSGPFKLSFIQNSDSSTSHKVIYMSRNDSYYKGTAKLARFQLNIFSTNDEIMRALQMNEVNAASDLSFSDTSQIDSKRYIVVSKPIQSGVYAIINTKSQMLQDVNLRKALQLATNTAAIREKLSKAALALDLPFTNGQLTGDVPMAPKFDIVAARKILDDNGWVLNSQNIREKGGQTFKLSVVTMKNSEFENVLQVLVGQWRSIGVVIETKVIDSNDIAQNVVQNILQPRNYDVLLYQLDIGADPDVYAYWHSSQTIPQGLNLSNYSNPISDDALLSARSRVEPSLRNAKYITFARQWLADVPAIGLYQSTTQYVHSTKASLFDDEMTLVSSIDRYSDVLDWSVGDQNVYKTP